MQLHVYMIVYAKVAHVEEHVEEHVYLIPFGALNHQETGREIHYRWWILHVNLLEGTLR